MELSPAEVRRAMAGLSRPILLTEAQADGVPCTELGGDCLQCDRAEPVRKLLLRLAGEGAGPEGH